MNKNPKDAIKLVQYVKTIRYATKVKVLSGGFGAGCANGEEGIVVKGPGKNPHWPDYAGIPVEAAVLFVKSKSRIYGLAIGCIIELL